MKPLQILLTFLPFFSQDDDDDDDDSEEDRDTPSYIAISNTPTRITLTAKVSQKRKRGPNKIKVKDQDNLHVCQSFLVGIIADNKLEVFRNKTTFVLSFEDLF